MSGCGDTRKGNGIVRVGACRDAPALEYDLLRRHVELRGRHARQPVAQIDRGDARGAGDGRCKPAGIVARCDGPAILGGVHVGDDPDILRLQSEHIGDDLCEDGAMALALRGRGHLNGHGAERIEADRCGCLRAVLRPSELAFLRSQRRGDVAHVGNARLDDRGKADAVMFALARALRPGAPAARQAGHRRPLSRASR